MSPNEVLVHNRKIAERFLANIQPTQLSQRKAGSPHIHFSLPNKVWGRIKTLPTFQKKSEPTKGRPPEATPKQILTALIWHIYSENALEDVAVLFDLPRQTLRYHFDKWRRERLFQQIADLGIEYGVHKNSTLNWGELLGSLPFRLKELKSQPKDDFDDETRPEIEMAPKFAEDIRAMIQCGLESNLSGAELAGLLNMVIDEYAGPIQAV